MSARSRSSGTEQVPAQASDQKAPVAKSVELNAAATPADEVGPPVENIEDEGTGPWARYSIILQRNIFSRQRSPFRPRERNNEPQVVVPNPETHFLLRGIAQEDNQFIAFIEDTQGGGVLRLRQGDRVARGTIKALNLDTLEYQLEDKTISIRLGCDLEGSRAATAFTDDDLFGVSPTLAPVPAATPAAQPARTQQQAPAPPGNEAEILKRLMEQRRQQLGQ